MKLSKQSQLEQSLEQLGANSTQGWGDIEKQYRQLAQQWHPDRNAGHGHDAAKNKFIEINSAYNYIRSHYRKTGSIQTPMSTERHGPLLGTKKQTVIKPTLYKNKFFIAAFASTMIAVLFGALLWSLDSRLAENNRGRASAEQTDITKKSNLAPQDTLPLPGDVSKQSSADAAF